MLSTTIDIDTERHLEVRDVTASVRQAVTADHTGAVLVHCRHTTAGIVINEAESRLLGDLVDHLRTVVDAGPYRHDEIDDNAAAHLRASILGPSVVIPVVDGDLDLGTWQSVLFVECDGPRRRTVAIRPLAGKQA
ncbi:MAG: secondary thiamine-phosphate synthase enzyme YjbQ [Halobacteriota archaeon]